MDPLYFYIMIICILSLCVIGLITCIVLLVKQRKKRTNKVIVFATVVNVFLLLLISLYAASHSTYYKYNDWIMLKSNIHIIEQKYGKFDLGEINDNRKGRVGYYIYTDNGPVMPDHLDHYYYMEYDEMGEIYKVYEACQPGG